ncbi:hypothetical protein D0X99_06190 [Algoriphagus lacus]|uniref:Uncharacterized protein n=1 Tax=Algoriphagus lacus TaxID=2056311 RepID=A0A418PV20_9BACT|nr:hypothetical protein [Algoriphagus lacus]RIW17326.1 hypothetical protein D0X99_06190 [Algoriphagus lacus]
MNSRIKKIILVDQHMEMNPTWMGEFSDQTRDLVILDPVQLFAEIDWTRYEEDVQVINQIYSRLFEEVVIANKRLVCFWPLVEQYGNDWFELASLCNHNQFELEVYKHILFESENYGFSSEILSAWKKFVYFLIESLMEDIHMNEQFDEIATLIGENESIVLFRMETNGNVRYSFASSSEYFEITPDQIIEPSERDKQLPFFDSFNEMLVKLSDGNDLSKYQTKFVDRQLEKAYFNVLAKDFKIKNLIQNWLETYSLN